MKSNEEWSSLLWTQFIQLYSDCVQGSLKEFRTSMGFEPVTSQYWCDALTNWAMKPLMLGTHKSLKTRFNLIVFPLITSTQVMNSQTWKINITTLTNLEPFTVFQFFKESKISFQLLQCESWSWFLSSSYYCSSCRLSESICLQSHQQRGPMVVKGTKLRININNLTFRSSIFLHLESTLEILGILGIFKVTENSYPSSPHSKSRGFCPQTFSSNFWVLFKLSDHGANSFLHCSSFPILGPTFLFNFLLIFPIFHDWDTFDFSQDHVTKNQPMAVPV